MKNVSRRDVWVGLPALAALGARAMRGQTHATEFPAQQSQPEDERYRPGNNKVVEVVAGGGTLGAARAIPMDSIPATATANGGERRRMLHGTLATGETVEVHQSTMNPGTPAPALHVIHHSEMVLVREGTMKFQHEVDGKIVEETVGPGGVFYVAYGTNHAVSNAGAGPARYFVVEVGGDV